MAVDLITSSPRPVTIDFAPPEQYALTFPEPRLGIALGDMGRSLPVVIATGCAVTPSLPLAGDVVTRVGGCALDASLAESAYDQAVRLITTGTRPVTVEFAAPPLPQSSVADALSTQVSATNGAAPASDKSFEASTEQHYEVVFVNAKLGMGLQAGEQQGDLPVVTTSPPGMALPAVGDRIESVNGQKLVGSPDPYSRAVELIASSGPLTQGFISKSVASGAQPKAVSALGVRVWPRRVGPPFKLRTILTCSRRSTAPS